MNQSLTLGDIKIEVIKKNIKNVHLSVLPPSGRVRIAAPLRMNLSNIRLFVISKISWIKKQQKQFRSQKRETPREFIERESHYLWGKRFLLHIEETTAAPKIILKHRKLIMHVRPRAGIEKRRTVFESWYRDELRVAAEKIILKWEPVLKVKVKKLNIRKMKTRWGSCNTEKGYILLNTELAKKPKSCLEYIIVHEMIHLIERSHNKRFVSLMDRFMPQWEHVRGRLNGMAIV